MPALPRTRRQRALQRDTCSACARSSYAVEAAVNGGGDGLDLRRELLLDHVEIVAVLIRYHVHGEAQVAEATRAPDAVQVCLGRLACGERRGRAWWADGR